MRRNYSSRDKNLQGELIALGIREKMYLKNPVCFAVASQKTEKDGKGEYEVL